jgi:hypothetical protein
VQHFVSLLIVRLDKFFAELVVVNCLERQNQIELPDLIEIKGIAVAGLELYVKPRNVLLI